MERVGEVLTRKGMKVEIRKQMATVVEVPQLGNTVEECLVTRWVRHKGESVSAGDVVAEIETDKTTFEITAPVDGTVLETFHEQGALVPVFAKLFVIGEAGEASGAGGEDGSQRASASTPLQPGPADLPAPPDRPAPMSPRARGFAAAHQFEPGVIDGSGPGGRVLEQDVRKAYEAAGTRPASNIRQTIARRMRESLASTAQYTLHTSADARALLDARARSKKAGGDVTIGELVAFCTIQALLEAPDLNAEFIDGRIVTHASVHLAFACDTARGLMAPVVRDAQTLSIEALSSRMKDLTTQALDGTIAASDLCGATFTVSNLGSLGIESFTPVLNPPQVAILGVGAIQLKSVPTENGVALIDAIGLSLTCDHQVIDGAPGARFLQVLKGKLETTA